MGMVLMGVGSTGGVWSHKAVAGICNPIHNIKETVDYECHFHTKK